MLPSPRRVARTFSRALILSVAFSASALASAYCARDAGAQSLMARLAWERFRQTDLPELWVCAPPLDPWNPRVVGRYNPAARTIQIAQPILDDPQRVTNVIAHELAHHYTFLRDGINNDFGGHGPGFLRTLVEAGFWEEAARTAAAIPGLAEVFQAQFGVHPYDVLNARRAPLAAPMQPPHPVEPTWEPPRWEVAPPHAFREPPQAPRCRLEIWVERDPRSRLDVRRFRWVCQ